MAMMNLLHGLLFPLLSSANKAAQQSTGAFSWRDVLTILSIVIPLVLGAFIYLLRKKQEAENELRKQQIQDVKESVKRAQADADAALRKIESTINQHLSHQTMCVSRFVSNDVYKQDMETQSSHVASMKGTIDTLNQIMVHQQTLVVQLVKTLP